jgi:hypothetical protein
MNAQAGGRKNNSFRGKFMIYPGLIGKFREAGGQFAGETLGQRINFRVIFCRNP